jgi:predicted O-methyltransferase YrrM
MTPRELTMSSRDYLFSLRMAVSAARFVPRVPITTLEQAFPGIENLTIAIQHQSVNRGLRHAEAFVLSLITAYLQPRRIFEIGTGSGESTLLMARQAPQAQIDTLDLGRAVPALGTQPREPPVQNVGAIGCAYRESENSLQITQHFGDSATFDYKMFEGEMDLVFVDGSHTYDYVKSDSRIALSLIQRGGTIVWDDCNYVCPGVSKALVELRQQGHPVYRVYGTRLATLHADAGHPEVR